MIQTKSPSAEPIGVARKYVDGQATLKELTAAWDAARDAERQWQTKRLMEILHRGGGVNG